LSILPKNIAICHQIYSRVFYIVNYLLKFYKKGFCLTLGSCPYCEDGNIEIREKLFNGKKVKLFACSNAKWITHDGEFFEMASDASCNFRIWQNALSKYGKWFTYKEIRNLLQDKEISLELISKKYGKKITYFKTIILNREYGVSVLWD